MEYNKNNPEVLLGVYYNLGIDALTNAPLADFLADYAYGGGGWEIRTEKLNSGMISRKAHAKMRLIPENHIEE